MQINVVVVDDEPIDRYMVKRRFSKIDLFNDVDEAESGEEFLARYFNSKQPDNGHVPLLVLMDINMPRLDGFATIAEMENRQNAGFGPTNVLVMMFSSSNNPKDRQKANQLASVKGYIVKPIEKRHIDEIKSLISQELPG